MSLAFQSVAPGDYFEFTPDCVLDGDYGVHLEYKGREHRAKLVNRQRIVAFHQHMTTPLAHTYDEKLDLEIGWRLPLTKHLEDPLLGILILYGRTCGRSNQLITYFMFLSSLLCKFVAHRKRHRRDLAQFTRLRAANSWMTRNPERALGASPLFDLRTSG